MFSWLSLALLFLVSGIWVLLLLNAFDITFHLADVVSAIEEAFQ